jgi:hypothetical protein
MLTSGHYPVGAEAPGFIVFRVGQAYANNPRPDSQKAPLDDYAGCPGCTQGPR